MPARSSSSLRQASTTEPSPSTPSSTSSSAAASPSSASTRPSSSPGARSDPRPEPPCPASDTGHVRPGQGITRNGAGCGPKGPCLGVRHRPCPGARLRDTSMTTSTGTLPPEGVRSMFDRIAPVYDAMNRLMTAGLDRRWRAATAAAVVCPGDRVLDACCGTGDLAIADAGVGGLVTGLDFSEPMLERARKKSETIDWIAGDALALPFAEGSFDAVTVGFGVRHLDELE